MKHIGTRNIFLPWPNKALFSYVADVEPESTSQACRQKIFSCQVNIYQVQMKVENQTARDFFGSIFQ